MTHCDRVWVCCAGLITLNTESSCAQLLAQPEEMVLCAVSTASDPQQLPFIWAPTLPGQLHSLVGSCMCIITHRLWPRLRTITQHHHVSLQQSGGAADLTTPVSRPLRDTTLNTPTKRSQLCHIGDYIILWSCIPTDKRRARRESTWAKWFNWKEESCELSAQKRKPWSLVRQSCVMDFVLGWEMPSQSGAIPQIESWHRCERSFQI